MNKQYLKPKIWSRLSVQLYHKDQHGSQQFKCQTPVFFVIVLFYQAIATCFRVFVTAFMTKHLKHSPLPRVRQRKQTRVSINTRWANQSSSTMLSTCSSENWFLPNFVVTDVVCGRWTHLCARNVRKPVPRSRVQDVEARLLCSSFVTCARSRQVYARRKPFRRRRVQTGLAGLTAETTPQGRSAECERLPTCGSAQSQPGPAASEECGGGGSLVQREAFNVEQKHWQHKRVCAWAWTVQAEYGISALGAWWRSICHVVARWQVGKVRLPLTM